ncbi:MAG: hypothetical protein V1794_19245, partial [Candidatus Glassbacteria bacterium]
LAPLVALFGANFTLLKLESVLFSLGTVLISCLLALRLARPLVWAALTLAVALNPVLVEYSHWVLSEISFVFFSLLALYFLVRAEEKGREERYGIWFWAGIVCLAFTVHIRSVGYSFVIAGLAYYGLKRNWKRLAVFALAVGVLLAPWKLRDMHANPEQKSYGQWLLLKNPYEPEQGSIGAGGVAWRIIHNFRFYSFDEMARTVIHERTLADMGGAARLAAGLISLLVFIGLAVRLLAGMRFIELYALVYLGVVLIWPEAWSDVRFIRGLILLFLPVLIYLIKRLLAGVRFIDLTKRLLAGMRFIDYYVLVYLGVVLIWPEVWSDVRFIMALIPLFLLYAGDGAAWCAGRAGAADLGREKAAAAVVCLLALAGLASQARLMPENLNMLGNYLAGDRYAGYPDNWRQLFETADWARDHTPEKATFTVRKPTLFFLFSGRHAECYPFTADTDSVLAMVFRNDYVVVDAVSGTTSRYLVPALVQQQNRFRLVFDRPYAKVLEVVH